MDSPMIIVNTPLRDYSGDYELMMDGMRLLEIKQAQEEKFNKLPPKKSILKRFKEREIKGRAPRNSQLLKHLRELL